MPEVPLSARQVGDFVIVIAGHIGGSLNAWVLIKETG
jgi:hypothetical protein